MADSALAVFQQAENELRAGQYPAALASYQRVVRGVPRYHRARFRVADTLLNIKARAEALEVYKSVAWHALKAGQPLSGLVAIKMAALLDPRELEAIEILAELYSRASDRIGETVEEEALRYQLTESDQAAPPAAQAPGDLVSNAAREAADTSAVGQYTDKLPGIPLFSFLDEDAFVAVLASLQLRRFAKGNVVIAEGQPGDSFFILAEGSVEVTRKVGPKTISLARLKPGAVFGEMALISKAPRTATVIASDDCDLLELKRASLEAEAQKLASVTQALKDFTHERFLANLTATSPIFKPFPRSIRSEIVRKFKDFPVDPGDELIAEGEEGQGLFLVLKGNVEVSKKGPDGKVVLATLKEGDVFGEISLLQETPTTATCTAVTRGELLFLPKKDFASTLARHPELRDELSKITSERLRQTKELLETAPLELIEDDDLIML
jgi:CRP-like cAMP-binding protein